MSQAGPNDHDGGLCFMSQFNRFGPTKIKATKTTGKGVDYVDYKDIENLRRMMSANGKIFGRKRLSTTAREQRMVAQAVKRARFMGLLPYTSATL
jgi:small subunit ribosomal protein S18